MSNLKNGEKIQIDKMLNGFKVHENTLMFFPNQDVFTFCQWKLILKIWHIHIDKIQIQ